MTSAAYRCRRQWCRGLDKNFESIDDLENDVVDCVLDATALVDPLPMNEEAFQTRREDARGRLSLVAGEVSRLLTEIVAQAAPAALKLKRIENEALSADVAEQLKRLFPPHFLLSAPLSQLMNYPRYLKAVLYRLEHYSSDPARDVARQADVERLTPLWYGRLLRAEGSLILILKSFAGCSKSFAFPYLRSSCAHPCRCRLSVWSVFGSR